jgi:hypothetical protein
MSTSSSSSSSSWSFTPAAGLGDIKKKKQECKVTVKSVKIEEVPEEELKKRRLKIKIKNVLIA